MRARVVGVAVIAVVAGLGAAFLVMKLVNRPDAPAQIVEKAAPVEMVEVLVAARDVALGGRVEPADFKWASWPKDSLPAGLIIRAAQPNALDNMKGAVSRAALIAGEPVREERMVKADRGFMSIILSPGMRAVAIEVKTQATAGGFILPNDHVDIILTRAAKGTTAQADAFVSETILTNVKVLAIDQTIAEKEGQPTVVVKDTVTLELSQLQAELLAQSQPAGTISLTLRALRDATGDTEALRRTVQESSSVTIVRAGVPVRTTAQPQPAPSN